MKKSTRTLLGTSLAAALGAALLLGGTGTLAFWSDTATSTTQQIQSGTLDLGSSSQITTSGATLKQCTSSGCGSAVAYAGGPLVPGDVITTTVNVPVTLVGENLEAQFTVTPSKTASAAPADAALANALTVTVKSVNNIAATTTPATTTLTPTQISAGTVPVVLEIEFPWGAVGQYNTAMGGTVSFAAAYTLTQIPAG